MRPCVCSAWSVSSWGRVVTFRRIIGNPELLLRDKDAFLRFKDTLHQHELTISALAMHGEPLNPNPKLAAAYDKEFRDACDLAERLGVRRITLLSGLPEGLEGDSCPNWILYPYSPENLERLEWQWEKRLLPYWKQHAKIAEGHGIRLCFEMHPVDMVYKPE